MCVSECSCSCFTMLDQSIGAEKTCPLKAVRAWGGGVASLRAEMTRDFKRAVCAWKSARACACSRVAVRIHAVTCAI